MPDHEVVEEVDVEQPPGGQRLGGQVEVVRAGGRVAARVVVDEDDPAGVQAHGVTEELADPDEARRHVALIDGRDPKDHVLRVEQDRPKLLVLEPAHLEDEPIGDVDRRADRPAPGRPVRQQAPAELERGRELGGLGGADPGDRLELEIGRPGEAGQPVVPPEGFLGEVDGAHAPRAGSPDQGDELGGGETARSTQRQPLARPFGEPGSHGSLAADPPGGRAAGGRARQSCGWSSSDSTVVIGRPRTRTTGARRSPPPSGPGNDATVSADPYPGLIARSTARLWMA